MYPRRNYQIVSFIKHLISRAYQLVYIFGDHLTYRSSVDFSTWVSQEEAGFDEKRGNQYQPSDIRSLKKALSLYRIQDSDALIDIGCGKGKVMCVCAKYPFQAVHGLELSPALAETAQRNFSIFGLEKCRVIVGDAVQFTDYDEYTFFYMFNPFPENVFRAALQNIMQSLERVPRKCVLIYMNPVYHNMIEEMTPFHLAHTVNAITFWFSCKCYEYDPEKRK